MPSESCQHFRPEMFLKHSYNDKDVFAELCALFLQVGGEQFARLQSAILAGNIVLTTQECHALKGTMLIAGADAVVGMLNHIDHEFNRKKLVCTPDKIVELEAEIKLTLDEVHRYLVQQKHLENAAASG
jgi:HPt (histidine-containing phosphotransfer) domain-containing protein